MSSSRLEQLPIEVLSEIAGFLHPYTEAFNNFSLLSSKCRSACEPYLFRDLRVRAYDRKRLALDVEALHGILDVHDRYRWVRTIRVSGTLPPAESPENLSTPGTRWMGCHIVPPAHFNSESMKPQHEDDAAYQPLVALLHRTNGLKHFEFDSLHSIPLRLLRALNAIPLCKLKLYNFYLQSPHKGLSEYERELVLSPCLHEARACVDDSMYADDDDHEFPAYLSESLLQLTSGITPHLQKLILFTTTNWSSSIWDDGRRDIGLPATRSEPYIPELPSQSGRPSVHTLVVQKHPETAASWLSSIELSKLRELDLHVLHCGADEFDTHFRWFSRGAEFTSLQNINFQFEGSDQESLLEGLAQFLRGIRQSHGLKDLRIAIHYADDGVFDAVLEHSSSLGRLSLDFFDWLDRNSMQRFITQLAPHATRLASLAIKIPEDESFDRPRLFASLMLAPLLSDLALSFRPADDAKDPSLAYLLRPGQTFVPASQLDWSHATPQKDMDLPLHTVTHGNSLEADAKINYVRALFGEMVVLRAKNHAGVGWPMSKLTLHLLDYPILTTLIVERDWFELRDLRSELLNIRIKEIRHGGNARILWPCPQCLVQEPDILSAQMSRLDLADGNVSSSEEFEDSSWEVV